jgi:hypothetical protein
VDAAPSSQQQAAAAPLQQDARSVAERWRTIPQDVSALNAQLRAAGIDQIKFP